MASEIPFVLVPEHQPRRDLYLQAWGRARSSHGIQNTV
jgi:hypothetical protein